MYLSEIKKFVDSVVEESLFQIDGILIEEGIGVIKVSTPYPEVMLKDIKRAGMKAGLSDTDVNEIEIEIEDKWRVQRWLMAKGYSSKDLKEQFPELINM